MRSALLGFVAERSRPRRRADATRKFLVRRSVETKDNAILFAKRSVLVTQKSAATKRNDLRIRNHIPKYLALQISESCLAACLENLWNRHTRFGDNALVKVDKANAKPFGQRLAER